MQFFEHISLLKSAYTSCTKPACERWQLTQMEFDVLMFLANNPQFDTAAEIVKLRKLTKSNVSVALKQLAARGLLEPYYQDGNRKTLHLRLLPASAPILEDGRAAQDRFGAILFCGFSSSDLAQFQSMMERISGNVRQFMQEV